MTRAGSIGLPAWILGDVVAEPDAAAAAGAPAEGAAGADGAGEVVRGAKGVDGGAVRVIGRHP